MLFLTYPRDPLPDLSHYVMLDFEGPRLSREDSDKGLFLIDGTWRYAAVMARSVKQNVVRRSLPKNIVTAYPRKQDDCPEPTRGLASCEALYVAYHLLGWDTSGLLDHYHWSEEFTRQFDGEFKNNK